MVSPTDVMSKENDRRGLDALVNGRGGQTTLHRDGSVTSIPEPLGGSAPVGPGRYKKLVRAAKALDKAGKRRTFKGGSQKQRDQTIFQYPKEFRR
jgi:hypothetical protein